MKKELKLRILGLLIESGVNSQAEMERLLDEVKDLEIILEKQNDTAGMPF